MAGGAVPSFVAFNGVVIPMSCPIVETLRLWKALCILKLKFMLTCDDICDAVMERTRLSAALLGRRIKISGRRDSGPVLAVVAGEASLSDILDLSLHEETCNRMTNRKSRKKSGDNIK